MVFTDGSVIPRVLFLTLDIKTKSGLLFPLHISDAAGPSS